MSQPLRTTAATTKRAPRTVAAALPDEVKPLPGIAGIVINDRLAKEFEETKKKLLAALRPAIERVFAHGAAEKRTLDDVVRTYMTHDAAVTAQVQLRAKPIKKLGVADAQILNQVKIPLRQVPSRTVVNPVYAGSGDAEGNGAVVIAKVIEQLSALIEAHPTCGVPADFFVRLPSFNLPVEDALLRALKLPPAKRAAPLGVLADIVVMRGEIETMLPLVAVLTTRIAEIQQQTKPALVA